MTSIKMDFTLPAGIAIEVLPEFFPGMRVVHRVEPIFPQEVRANRISGTVILRVLIGKGGTINNLQTIDGDPVLVAAAEEAVLQWRYEPVTIAGEPVELMANIFWTLSWSTGK